MNLSESERRLLLNAIASSDETNTQVAIGLKLHKHRGSVRPKTPCPYCGQMCDAGNMKKYHGDNCKLNTKR